MPNRSIVSMYVWIVVCVALVSLTAPAAAGPEHEHHEELIKEALSAAPAKIAEGATVMNWDGKILKEGDNGWTCMPTPPLSAKTRRSRPRSALPTQAARSGAPS